MVLNLTIPTVAYPADSAVVPDGIFIAPVLENVVLPETVKPVNVPSEVMFDCEAVDNVPTNAVLVTLVKPANVVELAPKVIAVVPTVTALDASFETAMAALALMSALTIVPSKIIVLVTVPVSPEPTNVPDVGKVTVVFAVAVSVVLNAPDVTKFPPRVIVLTPLFTPVPPYVAPINVPCQTPVPIVPTDVSEEVTTEEPKVVALKTSTALILYVCPVATVILLAAVSEPIDKFAHANPLFAISIVELGSMV